MPDPAATVSIQFTWSPEQHALKGWEGRRVIGREGSRPGQRKQLQCEPAARKHSCFCIGVDYLLGLRWAAVGYVVLQSFVVQSFAPGPEAHKQRADQAIAEADGHPAGVRAAQLACAAHGACIMMHGTRRVTAVMQEL